MATRVTIYNEQAIREAYRISTEQRARIAHQAAADARADAPVRSGEFRGGIGVEVNGDQVMLVDNDPEAFYKEYGTADTPAHATLTDAARKYGRYSGFQPKGRKRS
jgi:hypothetical protein